MLSPISHLRLTSFSDSEPTLWSVVYRSLHCVLPLPRVRAPGDANRSFTHSHTGSSWHPRILQEYRRASRKLVVQPPSPELALVAHSRSSRRVRVSFRRHRNSRPYPTSNLQDHSRRLDARRQTPPRRALQNRPDLVCRGQSRLALARCFPSPSSSRI